MLSDPCLNIAEITARALSESKPLFVRSKWCTDFLRNVQSYSVEGSIKIIFESISEFNLMNDEINYSTQISSKKNMQ